MVNDFEKCLEFVLKMEGGFTDNPDDHGGATNKGIIQTEYDTYRHNHGLATQSVRLISDTEVQAIYKISYWNEIHGDYVAMPLCMALFDSAVTAGSAGLTSSSTNRWSLARRWYGAIKQARNIMRLRRLRQ